MSATFPIVPSRTFAMAALVQGVVALHLLAGREAVRGVVGGALPTTVTSGGARVVVPGGSVPTDTVITLTPTVLSSDLPTGTGIDALAEVVLDLVAWVERLDGVSALVVVARGAVPGDGVVTTTTPGLPGVTRGGRYVFYRVSGPVGWVAATITNGGRPTPGAVITETSLPFLGLTSSSGQALVPASPGARTITARVPRTVLVGTAAVAVTTNTTTIALAGTALTATVAPPTAPPVSRCRRRYSSRAPPCWPPARSPRMCA